MNLLHTSEPIEVEGPMETWMAQVISQKELRARNWGLVCGFGYGFAAATFAFMILLFATAPHV
jgi:hypothetical protein